METVAGRRANAAGAPSESRADATEAQNWKLIKYFNLYRLAIALAAAGIALTVETLSPFGDDSPPLFKVASIIYALTSLAALQTIRLRRPDFESHVTILSFADVTLLTMLMHASGGLSSGLGLMLLVAVAGTSLMTGRQLTIFYASLATIAVLLEHSWDLLLQFIGWLVAGHDITPDPETLQNFPQVGLFGVGLFATAYFGNFLAARLSATEALAERQEVDLANLTQINALIIERMQSGVLVCDPEGNVRLRNRAAQKLLGTPAPAKSPRSLSEASPDLAIQLFQWRAEKADQRARRMFRSKAGYTLLPRFVSLGNAQQAGTLIFLEDMAILKQQAQQLKMAALARLTASIAHEIRNPLGALSNAAQLLSETGTQAGEERRLVKIISEQSRRMNVIVQNVTQLSRRDRVNPALLALQPWLQEFTRQYAETAMVPADIITLQAGPDIDVCADPEQLYQVVSNLCQNAMRHSPPFSGTPLIKLQVGTDAEGRPFLDVIDWGGGVPPEIVDNIFDPFFTTTPKGTGLGLYIARELCEGNGGSLDYFPGEGGVGARFRVTLARADECAEFRPL